MLTTPGSHGHKRVVCKCGNVLLDCRCPSLDKLQEVVETCDKCAKVVSVLQGAANMELHRPPMERILWVALTASPRMVQLSQHPEFISTYRKGTKWLRPDLIGQRVQLVNCKVAHPAPCSSACVVFGEATVISVKACAFQDIEYADHTRQSSDMQSMNDRLHVMRSVYGSYEKDTITTVITLGGVLLR